MCEILCLCAESACLLADHMQAGSAHLREESFVLRLSGDERVTWPVAGGARYHSHTDEAADAYAGLMGAVIVSKRGTSRPDGTPLDVDRCALQAAFPAQLASITVGTCTSAIIRHAWLPGPSHSMSASALGITPFVSSLQFLCAFTNSHRSSCDCNNDDSAIWHADVSTSICGKISLFEGRLRAGSLCCSSWSRMRLLPSCSWTISTNTSIPL